MSIVRNGIDIDRDGKEASWQKDAVEIRTREPKHILFLCMANSIRSQMAEGLAKAILKDSKRFSPSTLMISSAGAIPGYGVHESVVAVLQEEGIEVSGQFAKGAGEVDLQSVDVVITLCAEEVCPIELIEKAGAVMRVHWKLPDPSSIFLRGSEDRLLPFRKIREILRERLQFLLM
ncbi:MAG: arsenate reductase ArsC [Oligoflexia bacterium]|nr:arsenate reductase ArsC [Oligoflexia bacterium]MBF0366906.1 arsenate reductase ArsC [Oligoflexia bacterium]